jgi:shikimate kinase
MNIVLIGFMGSGKSSVAFELGKKLNMKTKETDTLVLAKSKRKSIKDIFLIDGEIRFRELEIEIAKKLSGEKEIVISTGGGIVMNKICIDYLKQNGTVIFLSTTFAEIERRLKGDTTRPLFMDKKQAQKLFMMRKQLYKNYTSVTIKTDGKSIDEITHLIMKKI